MSLAKNPKGAVRLSKKLRALVGPQTTQGEISWGGAGIWDWNGKRRMSYPAGSMPQPVALRGKVQVHGGGSGMMRLRKGDANGGKKDLVKIKKS